MLACREFLEAPIHSPSDCLTGPIDVGCRLALVGHIIRREDGARLATI
jgi:hypothetical protein